MSKIVYGEPSSIQVYGVISTEHHSSYVELSVGNEYVELKIEQANELIRALKKAVKKAANESKKED